MQVLQGSKYVSDQYILVLAYDQVHRNSVGKGKSLTKQNLGIFSIFCRVGRESPQPN